jgi:hypothetical protein
MVNFVRGQAVKTREATVTVDAGLKPGVHRFRLVVVDERGLASKADEFRVEISELRPPVVPVRPHGPDAAPEHRRIRRNR